MATSAQARFERLFHNKPKPPKPATKGPHFSEKELLINQDSQEQCVQAPPAQTFPSDGSSAEEDDFVRSQAPSRAKSTFQSKAIHGTQKHPVSSQPGHIPGTSSDQPVFVPRGLWRGGLAATNMAEQDTREDVEPASSSRECVGSFCIWSLVAKFPYKYMQDPENRISRRFFASEKIFQRNWNVYYMLSPEDCSSKPLILVPLEQVQALIDELNQEFQLQVEVPPFPFQLSFYRDGTPVPHFLRAINSKNDMTEAHSKIPAPEIGYGKLAYNATKIQKQDHAAWLQKTERASEAEKKRKGGTKAKYYHKRELTVVEDVNSLERAQRYLGIRQRLPTTQIIRPGQTIGQEQIQQLKTAALTAGVLDLDKAAPFPFEDRTVIIAIDVESWELDHSIVTEVGVSTLDTADLVNVVPGKQGEEWIKKIRSRHFRIKGRERFRNDKYCHGNPDMFQFGSSEFVAIDKVADAVDSCFESPYSAGFECAGPPDIDSEGLPVPRKPAVLEDDQAKDTKSPRSLILVGHDIQGDITYLSTLGSCIFGERVSGPNLDGFPSRRHRVLSSIRERLDTTVLHKALTKTEQAKSLVKLCHELDITAWYAHNAGNDARYTLEAFIKLAIKARQADDAAATIARETGDFDVERALWEVEKEQRIEAAIETARQRMEIELSASDKVAGPGTHRRSSSTFLAARGNVARSKGTEDTSDKNSHEEAEPGHFEMSEASPNVDAW